MAGQLYTFLENVGYLSPFQLSFRLGFVTQVLLTMLANGLFSGKDIIHLCWSVWMFWPLWFHLLWCPDSGSTYRSQNSLPLNLYKAASQLKEQVPRCTPAFFCITQESSDIRSLEFIWPVFLVMLWSFSDSSGFVWLRFCIGVMQYAFKYDSEIAPVVQFSSEVIT